VKAFSKFHTHIFFVLIVLLALMLRMNVYSVEPYCDEETYDWLAFNLSQGRLRTGTSFMSVYVKYGAAIFGGEVEPWLDHPILYPFILSIPKLLSRILFGVDLVKFYGTRFVSMLIFCLPTIYLTMVVSKREFDTPSAIVGGLIYACVPSIILQQKMVFLDHGVTLFSILSLYTFIKYLDSESDSRLWVLSSIYAGMAALCKGTGLSAILALVLAITFILREDGFKKRLIRAISSLIIGGSLVSIYPLYGLMFNSKLFLAVTFSQLSKVSFEWLMRTMFEYPWSFHKGFYDGFLVLGWEAVAYIILIILRERQVKPSFIWLTCYLLFLILVAKHAYYYSQIAFYPFLSMFLGKTFIDVIKKLGEIFKIE